MAYDYRLLFVEIERILSSNPMIRLMDLAERLQCSHPIVEKSVISQTGFAFREYSDIKLLERCFDLWGQGHCVKDIAKELGYKWPDNFSRFFKNRTGLSLSRLNHAPYPGLSGRPRSKNANI
ncbi:MAG: helix-turn-helix transcriptional regulator [Acidobacteria bacterium]|nr:helix-turn-helix transcriptional regulator [Acidobacteriota bacterium]